MKKIVLTFGLISGAILAAMMAIVVPLSVRGVVDFDNAEIVGYTSMLMAFLLVFVGIRAYREKVGGGAIAFGRAFQVGILITLVASAVYVVAWEIVYFNFVPDFADSYVAHMLEKMREKGATDAQLLAEQQKAEQFKQLYANPLINIGITLMEIFPAGLIVTLVSAAILRRKAPQATAPVPDILA